MRKVLFYVVLAVLLISQILNSAENAKISMRKSNKIKKSLTGLEIVKEKNKNKSTIPQTIAHQGVIKEDGVLINGDFDLSFKIYSASSGGTALWSETHSGVTFSEGVFNVILGSVTPINLDFSSQYYIGITLGNGDEFIPRVQLTTSPYAFNAKTADIAMGIDNDVVVYNINGKQNNVTITGGDNITVDNSGNNIVINADVSGINDELVKVGPSGEAGYLSSMEFTSTTKASFSKKENRKATRGVIFLKNSSISESKLDIFNTPEDGNILVYGGAPANKMVWVAPEFAVDGDNLGNHTATANIKLNNKSLTNNGDSKKGLKIDNYGKVTVNNTIEVDSSAYTSGITIHKAGNPSITKNSPELNGIEVQGAKGNGLFVGRADNSGVKVQSAGGDGIDIYTVGGTGIYVGQSDIGLHINKTNTDGILVVDAGENGVKVFQAANDGIYLRKSGNASKVTNSDLNNGIEVDGAEGNGVFVGQADENGMHIVKAEKKGIVVGTVGDPSSVYTTDLENIGLEIQGTKGPGVFVGQSDRNGLQVRRANFSGLEVGIASRGVALYNMASDGFYVDRVGNPSAKSISSDKNGLEIAGSEGNGVFVGHSDKHGVYIRKAQQNGFLVDSANVGLSIKRTQDRAVSILAVGNPTSSMGHYGFAGEHNGIEILGTEGNGLYIDQADKSGITIYQAGNASTHSISAENNGVEIFSAEGNGVFIGCVDQRGIYIHASENDGIYANTKDANNEWGFYTPNKAYIGGGVTSAKMFSIGKNTGNEILEPGDLVVISGGYEKGVLGKENGNPVINVKKADKSESNSIFGVVEYSMKVRTEVEKSDDGKSNVIKSFRKANHNDASTGDYLSIVVFGTTDVKVDDRGIKAGDPVKLGDNSGVRKIKSTTINGIEIFENGGIVGKALEDSNGKGMVKVFVNCK